MKYLAVPLLAFVFLLSSCDDDDKKNTPPEEPAPEVKTGHFVDGAVSQLRFTTATQSGLTDADGTFSYEAGETVTFSVGGVTLGSAAGADRITPLDLFGATLPAPADAYFIAFNTLSVYSLFYTAQLFPATIAGIIEPPSSITGFEQALNVTMFLMALDIDGDASNGIDLTGRDSELANASLNFAVPNRQFEVDSLLMFNARFGAATFVAGVSAIDRTRNSAVELALAHLYTSLGIDASGQAISGNSTDSAPATFDDRGLISSLTTNQPQTLVRDSVGRITSITASGGLPLVTYSYSPAGQLTQVVQNGITSTFNFDANGRLTSRVNTQDASEPVTLAFSYDAATLTLTRTSSDVCLTRADTFDAQGRTTKVALTNFGGNCETSAPQTIAITYTYAPDGLLATSHLGVVAGASSGSFDHTVTRDAHGYATSETTVISATSEPTITATTTRTFDSAGRLLTLSTQAPVDDTVQTLISTVWTYTASGQPSTLSVSSGITGMIDQTFTYGTDGLLASTTQTIGTDDPVVTTYQYVHTANVIVSTYGLQVNLLSALGSLPL